MFWIYVLIVAFVLCTALVLVNKRVRGGGSSLGQRDDPRDHPSDHEVTAARQTQFRGGSGGSSPF